MPATRIRTRTAAGFARLIARGIRANFAPENEDDQMSRMAELFAEMAMSRGTDAEFSSVSTGGD